MRTQFARAVAFAGRHAVLLTLVLAGLAAAFASVGWSEEPADYSYFARAGRHLLRGELSDVYREEGNQGGPFELLTAAVLQRVLPGDLDLLVLQIGGAALLVVTAALGAQLLRRSLGLRPVPAVAVAIAAIVAVWEVPGYALDGHAAEVAVPVMWVLAGVLVQRGRPAMGAVILGLSCGWETWGALGLPILLASGWSSVRRLLWLVGLAAAVGAVVYLPFVLSGTFAMFEHRWLISVDTLPHFLGARGQFTWWMRILQGLACVSFGSAVALRCGGGRHALWLVPLAVTDTRLLLDPVSPYGYYFVLPQLLALTGIALLDEEPWRLKLAAGALAYSQFVVADRVRLPLLALSLVATYLLAGAIRQPARASAPAVEQAGR